MIQQGRQNSTRSRSSAVRVLADRSGNEQVEWKSDPVFTTAFGEVFRAGGLRVITTVPGTPPMNAVCERVIGTLRRELPDRALIVGECRLARVPGEYVRHYNRRGPHQSRRQRPADIGRSPSGTWPGCGPSAGNLSPRD